MGISTREQAVWARVMAASAQAPASPALPPEPLPTPELPPPVPSQGLTQELVLDLMAHEREDACTYEALASMASGSMRRRLLDLSRQESMHLRQLGAVYLILTGQRACILAPPCPRLGCLRDELRARYQEEAEGAANYHKLAETAGSFAWLLHRLGEEEDCHSRTILELLA